MGCTIFSVRIVDGAFVGTEGVVVPPSERHQTAVLASRGESTLQPVTVSTILDRRHVYLRVPPELLERIS